MFLESLRNVVIAQEARIKDLEWSVASLTDQKRRCEKHRKREGKFLESVIAKCKGDNVPLTEISCSEHCKKNKVSMSQLERLSQWKFQVKVAVCKSLRQTKHPPCSYWHQDTYRKISWNFMSLY